jgi:hypothetical protein
MKKLMMAVTAFGMLLTSCQNDLDFVQNAGETSTVSFSVGTPEIATRAYSDGLTAKVLQYAVYDSEGNILSDLTETNATINGSTTVNLQLTTGDSYAVIFWAAAENAPYTVNFDEKTMTVSYDGAKSNDEARDAFYKYHTFTVTGAQTETVELRRPFAQLNIGTSDYTASENAGYVPTTSAVTVKNIYTTLSLVDGAATGETEAVFAANAIPEGEQFPVTGYEYLAMNYLLVNSEKEVVDVEFTYEDANNDAKTRTVGSVPVKRNHRTNIYGQLLTSDVDIYVEIKPEYDDDDKYGAIDGQVYVKVSTIEEFNAAFADENVDIIILTANLVLDTPLTRAAADPVLTVSANKTLTIDLNGKKLSATSSATGKNYNMFDVRGTLTVKNGTMEYEHKGDNMGWNNFAELFYVGFNGTLNLDGVTAKNLGGSDMAYVIDMVNATNITVNVKNSTLESTYIPIRVFNNSKTGVNNVSIENSTLKGKYCFWVQYWLADGRDEATLEQTLKLDIFNSTAGESNNNTFVFANNYDAPVLYGFNEAVYFDQYGQKISLLTPIEGAEGVGLDSEGNYVVTADAGLAWVAANVAANDGFAGKTIKLDADIDLDLGNDDNGEPISNNPIGRDPETGEVTAFKGTFDGQGHTIANLYQSGWAFNYELGKYGSIGLFSKLEGATVKNVVLDGFEAQIEGGDISFVAGSATGTCVFENIEIKNGKIGTYNNGIGGIIGWSGAGEYTFRNIKLGSDVVLGGLWGSFDSSIGGIVGQAEPGATYNFENVEINCRIDAYNDCTASYDYYLYRMCGMIIGRCAKTTTINGSNYPDLSQYNMTFNNVVVNYGTWMNYHYCEPTPGHNNGRGMRIEPGYAYGGLPEDFDHTQCTTNHYNCIPFDQLIGGAQLGVKGLREVDGVTVNYPAEYTCPLCGEQHNVR